MNLSEQLATTVSQLSELVAINAIPTAEMAGRLAQWKAGGSLITTIIFDITAGAGMLIGTKLIKKYYNNVGEGELYTIGGAILCIISFLCFMPATIELLQKGPLWIAALTDWKVALAAQIMRML